VKLLGDFELLIVEGLKNWQLPRISLFRENFDHSYLGVSSAVALSDEMSQYKSVIPFGLDVFELDDVDGICSWILKNAKEI
jgi:molybdopterin-guanine dinucleotide biosynthesis protein B